MASQPEPSSTIELRAQGERKARLHPEYTQSAPLIGAIARVRRALASLLQPSSSGFSHYYCQTRRSASGLYACPACGDDIFEGEFFRAGRAAITAKVRRSLPGVVSGAGDALSQEQSNGNMHQCVLATGAAAILPG